MPRSARLQAVRCPAGERRNDGRIVFWHRGFAISDIMLGAENPEIGRAIGNRGPLSPCSTRPTSRYMTDHKTVAQESSQRTGADSVVAALLDHGIFQSVLSAGHPERCTFQRTVRSREMRSTSSIRGTKQGAAYMALGIGFGRPESRPCTPSFPGPVFLNTTAALATAYSTGAKSALPVRPDSKSRHRQGAWAICTNCRISSGSWSA